MNKSVKNSFENLQQTREIIRTALNYINGKVCDFGAGTAKYKNMILSRAQNYIALDVFQGENIDVVGDVECSPFKDAEFDTVICTQVLEHTRHPWLVAREIARILKPGGHAIITVPFMVPYHPDPEDNFRFTATGLKLIFEDAGLEAVYSGFYGKHFMAFSEGLHFHFASPYTKPSRLKNKIFTYTSKILRFFDRRAKNKNIFANTYLVAQKPLETFK